MVFDSFRLMLLSWPYLILYYLTLSVQMLIISESAREI